MRHETALGEKLKGAAKASGYDLAGGRLYNAAYHHLRKSAIDEERALAAFVAEVERDPSLLVRLMGRDAVKETAQKFLAAAARDMRAGGKPNDGAAGHSRSETHLHPAGTPSPKAGGVDQRQSAYQFRAENPGRPLTAIERRSIRVETQAAASRGLLDTLKVRGGKAIGDVRIREIPAYVGESRREAAILDAVARQARNMSPDMRIREVVTERNLAAIVANVDRQERTRADT